MPDVHEPHLASIQTYWNEHIHDLSVATYAPGTADFFAELNAYRFAKLHYLPRVVDFNAYQNQHVLEVGCGVGIDLVRFARGGAIVTGIDLAPVSIDLAQQNFAHQTLSGDLRVMNGEALDFASDCFDMVYAHGVLQYTADPVAMITEIHRVLKPGGHIIAMVYNRISWLSLMAQVTNVDLEHEDAPVFRTFTISEFQTLLGAFSNVTVVPERFPVATQLHKGAKAVLYNYVFVQGFNALPRRWVRRLGWHLMGFGQK